MNHIRDRDLLPVRSDCRTPTWPVGVACAVQPNHEHSPARVGPFSTALLGPL